MFLGRFELVTNVDGCDHASIKATPFTFKSKEIMADQLDCLQAFGSVQNVHRDIWPMPDDP